MVGPILKETVSAGVIWVGIDRWLRQILSFVIFAVLARLVGPDSFGLIALGGIYVSFMEIFVTQGFGTVLVQRKNLEEGHLHSAFWISMMTATALTLGSVLLAGPVAVLFGEPRLAGVLRWLACVLLVMGLTTVPQAILVRKMAFRALTLRSLLATVVGGVVGLIMAWRGWGVWSLVGQQLSGTAVGAAALWWASAWRPSFYVSWRHLRDLYGFAISILGNNLLWFGTQRADQFLIGLRFSAAVLGPYALVSRCMQLLIDLIGGPVAAVALPVLSRLQDEREQLRNAFYKATEMLGTIAMPIFFGIAALAPSFVPVVFGEQWSASVSLFQVLALFGMLNTTLCCGHPMILAIGRPGIYLLLFAFQTALTIGLCLLASLWSPLAVAAAVSVAVSVHSGVFLIVCHRLAGISIPIVLSRLWAPALLATIMLVTLLGFQGLVAEQLGPHITLVAGILLGASVYGIGMATLRPALIKQVIQPLRRLAVQARP